MDQRLQLEDAGDRNAATHEVVGQPIVLRRPLGGHHHGREVAACGVPADREPPAVYLEPPGVVPQPGDGAPHLRRDVADSTGGSQGVVDHGDVDPRRGEGLGHEAVHRLVAPLPVPAVDVEQDGTPACPPEQVEPLPLRRAIGEIELDLQPGADFGAASEPAFHQRVEIRFLATQLVLELELVRIHAAIEGFRHVPRSALRVRVPS